MVLDHELTFVAVNDAYEEATMRARDDLLGKNLFDLFPNEGESGRRLRASLEDVLETGETDTLAYLPYDIPRPAEKGGGMEKRYWTAVHSPLFDGDGNVAYVLQNTVDVTEMVRLREAANLPFRSGAAQLLERAQEAEEQHQALLDESEEFRRLFQQAPGFFAVLTGPEHEFTFANDAYTRLVGGRLVVGKKLIDALPEIEGQGFTEMLDGVYATGKPVGGEGMSVMLQPGPEQAPREYFLDFSYDVIRDSDGGISGIFVQGMDRTDTVKTQRRQRLLLDELNHRVKNTLASVQSIVSQTLRAARDTATAKRDIESRIIALSAAHNLLAESHWASAPLRDVVRLQLAGYGPSRIALSGPKITLTPKSCVAMSLVIHELATNSAKFGSLSAPNGTVSVNWSRDGDAGRFIVDWTELGGPETSRPVSCGFGSRMIEALVAGELGGSYTTRYLAEGLASRMTIAGSASAEGL